MVYGGVVDILIDLVVAQPRVSEHDHCHCGRRRRRSNRLIGGVRQSFVGGRLRFIRQRERPGGRSELEEPRSVEGDGRGHDDDDGVAQATTTDAVSGQRRTDGQIALGRDDADTNQQSRLHLGGSVVAWLCSLAVRNWPVGSLECQLCTMQYNLWLRHFTTPPFDAVVGLCRPGTLRCSG